MAQFAGVLVALFIGFGFFMYYLIDARLGQVRAELKSDLPGVINDAMQTAFGSVKSVIEEAAKGVEELKARLPAPPVVEAIKTPKEIRVLPLASNPPWSYFDPVKKSWRGVDVATLEGLSRDLGVKPTFIPVNSGTEIASRIGRFDIAILDVNPANQSVLEVLGRPSVTQPFIPGRKYVFLFGAERLDAATESYFRSWVLMRQDTGFWSAIAPAKPPSK